MKKKIPFIILFIILLSYALLVGGTMPYFLLYTYSLFFLVPLIHILIILNKLNITVKLPNKSLYAGDEITIDYKIDNNTFFHIPYLEIHSHISKKLTKKTPEKIIKSLRPHELYTYNETIDLKRRGYYELGTVEVIISDVFGIYSLRKKYSSKTSLLVYPEAIELSNFTINSVEQMGELSIEDLIFQDRSRIANLRDFREGDSIKSIHWKLSAKLDDIIIKEYEKRGDAQVIIFVNNYMEYFKKDMDRQLEDKIVDISLSIINYYINQNIPVYFYTQNNEEIIQLEGHDSSDLKGFLEFLARFKANGNIKFNNFLMGNMDNLNKDMTIIIITPVLDKSMGTLGIYLKTKGLKPLFILALDRKNNIGYLESSVDMGLKEEGIPLYLLDYHTSIKEALEGKNG